jgi:hypothetical protein
MRQRHLERNSCFGMLRPLRAVCLGGFKNVSNV